MIANLSSALSTGREATTWLNPPHSSQRHWMSQSIPPRQALDLDEKEKPQPEKQLFPPSHVYIFFLKEFRYIWALLCQNCHRHNERNQVNIIQSNRPPTHCISSTGPKRTYCAPPGKSYKTPHTPLHHKSQDFPGHASELCAPSHIRSHTLSSFLSVPLLYSIFCLISSF